MQLHSMIVSMEKAGLNATLKNELVLFDTWLNPYKCSCVPLLIFYVFACLIPLYCDLAFTCNFRKCHTFGF